MYKRNGLPIPMAELPFVKFCYRGGQKPPFRFIVLSTRRESLLHYQSCASITPLHGMFATGLKITLKKQWKPLSALATGLQEASQ